MNVIVRAGAKLYQRPGAVKLVILPESRLYDVLTMAPGWVQVAPRTWASIADCTFITDAPPVPGTLPEPGTSNPPPRDDLWFLNHSFKPREGKHKGEDDKTPMEGLPATWTTRSGAKYKVSPDLQDYIIGLHVLLHPDMQRAALIKELSQLFRNNGGWCNQTGWDSGEFKIAGLSSEGATVQATVAGTSPNIVPGGGKQWLEVYAIDPKNPPPLPASVDQIDMTRHFVPTTARTGGSNLFPNLDGRCLVPFLGKDGLQYVLFENVSKVDRIQMPCVPARPDAMQGLIP
jgi:hypothetical protein